MSTVMNLEQNGHVYVHKSYFFTSIICDIGYCMSVCLSVCLPICLYVCMCVYVCLYVSFNLNHEIVFVGVSHAWI